MTIGEAAMLYLLTSAFIFAALPNNCYCQITGTPIADIVASKSALLTLSPTTTTTTPLSAAVTRRRKSKELDIKVTSVCFSESQKSTTPASSIIFQRSKIFYVKAVHSEQKTLRQFLFFPCKILFREFSVELVSRENAQIYNKEYPNLFVMS
ncbi:hypothetical protein BG004_004734 [Podila humilis]|nr:hypothetical protein BG004_004734 [Podila humilis]